MEYKRKYFGYTEDELLHIALHPEPYYPSDLTEIRFKLFKRWFDSMERAKHSSNETNRLKATWEANGLYQALEMLGLHPMYLLNERS